MVQPFRNTANGTADAIIRTDDLTKVCASTDVRALGELDHSVTVGDSPAQTSLFDATSQLIGAGLARVEADGGLTSSTPSGRLTEGL
jgi:hypothetical protein